MYAYAIKTDYLSFFTKKNQINYNRVILIKSYIQFNSCILIKFNPIVAFLKCKNINQMSLNSEPNTNSGVLDL